MSLLSYLRDPAWQFVLTVFGIAVAILIYRLQKGHREIAFGAISVRSLLSVSEELSGRVVVTLDEKPVQDLHLIIVGLKNSGTCSILPSEFDRPAVLSFGDNVEIISWQITKEQPSNLKAVVNLNKNQLEVMPLLLNRGDYITLKVLVSTSKPNISADIRVVNIERLTMLNKSWRPPITLKQSLKNISFNLIIPISVIFSILIFFNIAPTGMSFNYLIPFIAGSYLLTILMWLTGIYFDNPSRRIDET